ncbi:MAG: hypothetical protein C5B49_11750 [Bdellovibrio sp.]|nr:MAG: hypothetical protein C5B49_11750 [Bdellovibrio sp.]
MALEEGKTYDAVDLQRMSFESLSDLAKEMKNQINQINRSAMRGENLGHLNFVAIEGLGRFHTEESLKALYALIRSELSLIEGRRRFASFDHRLLVAAIQAASKIGSREAPWSIEEMLDIAEETGKRIQSVATQLSNREWGALVLQEVQLALEKMYSQSHRVIELDQLLSKKSFALTSSQTRQDLLAKEAILQRRIIGQPKVIQAEMDILWRQSFLGKDANDTRSTVIWLMGPGGTGKETSAKAIADARHGLPGSWQAHLYPMDPLRTKHDLWRLLGSNTGFQGSEDTPDFIRFLVDHSGGKYLPEETVGNHGKKIFKYEINPAWKGEDLPGYAPMGSGVVYLHSFDQWTRENKDAFLLPGLDGNFQINSPNGGESKIQVRVHFVIASRDGTGLVSALEANGQRVGKPLTFKQQLQRWQRYESNKEALKDEIRANNGGINDRQSGSEQKGTSNELLKEIPDSNYVLMKPLSPEELQELVRRQLEAAADRVANKSDLSRIRLIWDEDLYQIIQEYDYLPESNATPMEPKIDALVIAPLVQAIKENRMADVRAFDQVHLSLATNPDHSRDLLVTVRDNSGQERGSFRQPIAYTEKDRPPEPLSIEQVRNLGTLGERLKQKVVGIDDLVDRIAEQVRTMANETYAASQGRGKAPKRAAIVILVDGLSSTGKSKLAEELHKELSLIFGIPEGAEGELLAFDFGRIKTLQALDERIFGSYDAINKNPIPSEFMKRYDRMGGQLVVALEELPNSGDVSQSTPLYDLFRKPVMTTFSDSKERPMGGVVLIANGNGGNYVYDSIPAGVPLEVRMEAMREIHRRVSSNYEVLRNILERAYPGPLLNRVGQHNIIFMPPHSYRSLRQLAQLKLSEALAAIADTYGRWGWNVKFASVDEYKRFVDKIVEEGFDVQGQGASIGKFVDGNFQSPLSNMLFSAEVPRGSDVVLEFDHETDNSNLERPGKVFYRVWVSGRSEPLSLAINRPYVSRQLGVDPNLQKVTAFHEAGHSVVEAALFGDSIKHTKLSVKPGVAQIGDQAVFYKGIARTEQQRELMTNREWLVRQIAVLAAGETGERLVLKGESHSTGKRNDMAWATTLATDGVIYDGLSEAWGTRSVPKDMTRKEYIDGLSEVQRQLLEREVNNFIREGRALAETTLHANYHSCFVPLGLRLVEMGEMEEHHLDEFYAEHPVADPHRLGVRQWVSDWQGRLRKWANRPRFRSMDVQFVDSIPEPAKIADIQAMARKAKQEQFDSVPLPEKLPILSREELLAKPQALAEQQFKKKESAVRFGACSGVHVVRTAM